MQTATPNALPVFRQRMAYHTVILYLSVPFEDPNWPKYCIIAVSVTRIHTHSTDHAAGLCKGTL